MYKLIASDLDGTLLNTASDLTPRTLRALRDVMAAGGLVALSSGRMIEATLPFARQIGVNAPMILFNGALIYDHRTDETLFANAIPQALAREVARRCEELGLYLQTYPGKGYFCNERTPDTKMYENSIRVPCESAHRRLSEWIQGDQVKMLCIAPREIIDPAQERLRREFPQGVHFMKSRDTFMEIVAEGIDKGAALGVLAEKLGVPMDEVLAFGDGQNDASMLKRAGLGLAMANSDPECLAAADRVIGRNSEDGVAREIEAMLAQGMFA